MSKLSPINDITTKIFDEICEEQFAKLKLDVMNITNIDTIGEDVLPHLAEQYHITGKEGWIFCETMAEKRTFIKNAIKLHATRGTKYAILKALKILNIDAKLTEWFEYNGRPFYFQVLISITDNYTEELEQQIIDLINENKNVRSWLEALQIFLERDMNVVFATCVITSEEIIV